MLNFGDIKKLADILKPDDENDSDTDDDLPKSGFAKLGKIFFAQCDVIFVVV